LRCLVREKLIEFLQKNFPQSLPHWRGEMAGESASQPAQTASFKSPAESPGSPS